MILVLASMLNFGLTADENNSLCIYYNIYECVTRVELISESLLRKQRVISGSKEIGPPLPTALF